MAVEPLPPTTTLQHDITLAGQRRINLIWELTQAFIAIIVVIANLIVEVYSSISPKANQPMIPESLSNVLFLIVGFYFSRTNHQAIGGVGNKPVSPYEGR